MDETDKCITRYRSCSVNGGGKCFNVILKEDIKISIICFGSMKY
jgi:hypothetical protein